MAVGVTVGVAVTGEVVTILRSGLVSAAAQALDTSIALLLKRLLLLLLLEVTLLGKRVALLEALLKTLLLLEVALLGEGVTLLETLLETLLLKTLLLVVALLLEIALLVTSSLDAAGVEIVLEIVARLTSIMGLASDLGSSGNIGALLGRADREDGGLPSLTLLGKLLVLSGLGADTARKVDVGEDAVLLGDSDVDLLVLGLLLGLLLALHSLGLSGAVVAAVDVGSVLRVALGLILGAVGLLLDLEDKGVHLVALVLDGLLNSLLQRRSDDLEHDGLEEVEEELVLGLLELDVEGLDVDVNLLNLEVVLAIRLVGAANLHLEGEAVTGQEDVENTSIGD